MRFLRPRVVRIGAAVAASIAVAAIVLALNGPSLGRPGDPSRAAVSVTPTERLAAGPYDLSVSRSAEPDGERAAVRITDAAGSAVAGKPVTGLLVYEGTAPGHEHHDIVISRETAPGVYTLDLRTAVPGPWLLTIVIDENARVGYLFTVR